MCRHFMQNQDMPVYPCTIPCDIIFVALKVVRRGNFIYWLEVSNI